MSEYIKNIVGVFEEVKRVLKSDGILWLNIGDGYTSGNRKYRAPDKKNASRAMSFRPDTPEGLKPKDLQGIPWRVAFALQQNGWYLRCDIIWDKPNAMPESVKDRPNRSHEYIFMLTKSKDYKYFPKSVQEISSNGGLRNRRSVWSVPVKAFKGNHPATFPESLIHPCILASSEPGDLILDPFVGAGTTALAARYLKRNFVGIELNQDYLDLAKERLLKQEFEL